MVNRVRNPLVGRSCWICLTGAAFLLGDYRPPAGDKPAVRGLNGSAILPGGRVIQPGGTQLPTGPSPIKIATSFSGRRIATANLGPERTSVTMLEQDRKGEWSLHNFLVPASGGIAFSGEKFLWVTEGNTGAVRLMDAESGTPRKRLELNRSGVSGSFSADLAFDSTRNLLFVEDQAHDRIVIFDTKTYQATAEASTGPHPSAISLSPDGKRVYVLSSSCLSIIDVTEAAAPKSVATIATADAGAVLAIANAVFVSHPRDDSIDVIDPATNTIRTTILLRIPGLESLRGIHPLGMTYDDSRHYLLVAEAGLNAIGVIDPESGRALGHLAAGWFPTSLLSANGVVTVANARGHGTGPSSMFLEPDSFEFEGVSRRGSVSRFDLPARQELTKPTRLVLAMNGLLQVPDRAGPAVPVHHVVIIVKGSRTFDDIFGDLHIPGSVVAGRPEFARFGNEGYADGGRKRFSLQQIPVTPNQHELAARFTSSDNFYADPDESSEGLSQYLNFNEAFDGKISDQARASHFISGLENKYKNPGVALPQIIFLHLPNDQTALPQPLSGYPYAASYAADNDLALGRVVEYLSHSPWWRDMAVFVTEAGTEGGRDHIDSHRTVFLGIGPWFRKGHVSHVNASYLAILKCAFRLLGIPPVNLSDVAAADLQDMFTAEPDYAPYEALPVDSRLYEAAGL